MKVIGLLSLTALCLQLTSAAVGAYRTVQCDVFAPSHKCVNPIAEGVVDGQWVGLISMFDGTNGGPSEIRVVSIGVGGNGLQTNLLAPIVAVGRYGDRIDAAFRRGKLVVSNAVYSTGEAHCCYTRRIVRRFDFHGHKLTVEREATVPASSNPNQVDAALGISESRGPSR